MDKVLVKQCLYHGSWLVMPFIAWLLWRISRDRGERSDGAVTAPPSPAAPEPEDRVERR